MSKSRDAFRTISEVSELLDTPAHVLRFWESKFSQIKPVKRAGGRRYYRPSDLDLLAGIKKLLHDDGMTIKGAQKLLRDHGVKQISALGAVQLKQIAPPAPPEPQNRTPTPAEVATPTTATGPTAQAPAIQADPADTDSKASARVFHLLHHASRDGLAAQAKAIVPLLDRLQNLRDRVAAP